MKTIPAASADQSTGRQYWRSLDQLAETPEFREYLHREFPEGASELDDPVTRRHFVKIMSASFALAGVGLGATGCRKPEEKVMPFGKASEDYVHGVPQYFATAMPTRVGAVPLIAKSNDGRPTKLEGNPLFPGGNGATDRYTQAAILNLYDPDRATTFHKAGATVSRETALGGLADLAKKFSANQGEGLALLGERKISPSRHRLHKIISEKLPKAKWYLYEAIDSNIHAVAATQAFGKGVRPLFRFDAAKAILSLDCDFIGGEDDAHNSIHGFSSGRNVEQGMNRLYAVESLFSLTGVNADHRLRTAASAVINVAAAIAKELGVDIGSVSTSGVDARWVTECAKDLKARGKEALVVAGLRQPLAVHLLAHAINAKLESIGTTVELREENISRSIGSIADLAGSLNKGEVDTLVLVGVNPVYDAPSDLNWAATQKKAKSGVVRLGYYAQDETGAVSDWHFPFAHFLESWGDALTTDGTYVPIQPLIAPLFGAINDLEFLARLGGLDVVDSLAIVRETFAGFSRGGDLAWKRFLHDGFLPGSTAKPESVRFESSALSRALAEIKSPAAASASNLEVVLHRDYSLDDGRYANNGWLQEFPDPVTKITWDNVILVSRKTARELNVKNGDIVTVTANGQSVDGAIWTQPGMADFSLGIALGYGRQKVGRVGQGVGFNAYPLRTTTSGFISTGATIKPTGKTHVIACTQDHWSMEGRPIVREANFDQYQKNHEIVETMDAAKPPVEQSLYPNPLDEAKKGALHQWGMAIDLSSCVGCGTCILACQSENNIPIVGKDQVKRGRELHWLRIDRYFSSKNRKFGLETYKPEEAQQFEEWIDDVQAVNQPMLCQHCESAPCESVCPVNATVHDHEGLNVMAYNRCVGTRYCSNNCPYKVRRFNYLDFNKRPLSALKGPLYPTPLLNRTKGEWDLLRWWKNPESGMREDDEWDLIKMVKNPDVTVRMRGVMEKCTYCTQRIEGAKIAQKVKAKDSGDVRVPDGTFTTACAQACPAGAIVFGDISDPNSRVSKLKANHRNYSVLEFLLTKPRTTYLARLRNPNPAMPDFTEAPWSSQEFDLKNHHGSHDSHDDATDAKKGAH